MGHAFDARSELVEAVLDHYLLVLEKKFEQEELHRSELPQFRFRETEPREAGHQQVEVLDRGLADEPR